MWPRYTESSLVIGGLVERNGRGEDAVAQALVKELAIDQIHLPTSVELAQLSLDLSRIPAGGPAGFVLDKHINVAVGPEVVARDGAEDRKTADPVAPAEFGQGTPVDGER